MLDRAFNLVRCRGRDEGSYRPRREANEEGVDQYLVHLQKRIELVIRLKEGAQTKTNSNTALWIDLEHSANEILCVARQVCGHREAAELDLCKQSANVFVIKGQATGEEGKQNDAAWPDIGWRAVIGEALKNTRKVIKLELQTMICRQGRLTETISGLA
jgi:hypothetical protein